MTVFDFTRRTRVSLAALVTGVSGIATACQPAPALSGPTVVLGDSLIQGYTNTGLQGSVAPDRQPVTVNATLGRRAEQNLALLKSDYSVRNSVNHAATIVIGDGTNPGNNYAGVKRAQLDLIFGINPDARVILLPMFATKNSALMTRQNNVLHALSSEYASRGQNVMVAMLNIPAGCLGRDRVHPTPGCYSNLQRQVAGNINAPSSGNAPPAADLVK